ncbi:MAG: site-specific integrase, partial [Rhodospirillaceae bacterium]
DPLTDKRRQEFFERQCDAAARRSELIVQVANRQYVERRNAPTVADAVDRWIADREGKVKARTLKSYKEVAAYIRGPLIIASAKERAAITSGRLTAAGRTVVPMLGTLKLTDLKPGDIRDWHRTLFQEVGAYSSHRAKSVLRAVLALAEEDTGIRAVTLPRNLSRARQRPKKAILTPFQVSLVLAAARQDRAQGIYYAFPFLVGTRPSEQLGLMWDDVDFEANVIRIRRIQERDGSLTDMTKTVAGTRDVPMAAVLREMLLEWRLSCPRKDGELQRVFPGPGRLSPWPKPRRGGGGPLLYQNFRKRLWAPALKNLPIPYVTPHSARHSFISILQAQGVEVGLVAKLAGHANATVTLGHYTQAVRGGEEAVAKLQQAYQTAG